MGKLRLGLIIGIICLLAVIPSKSIAQDEGKAILIIMDRISWKAIDEANTPNIDKLIEMGAIGLMTTNTGGSLSQNNSYLTLGSGARVTGVTGSQSAFTYGHDYRGEKIENLIYQINGNKMIPGAIANPSIAKLHRNNANRPYKVSIGALGTALRDGGLSVAVLGNCDNYNRAEDDGGGKNFLVSMMMDDRGIVPLGDIGQSLIEEDSSWPMGIKTDYEKMFLAFGELQNHAHVIAIQLGDTSRAEDFRHQSMDSRIEYHKRRALEEGDKFIGKLMEHLDLQRDYIMMVTPLGPAEEIGNNNRLTPIIIAGKDVKKGWLSSGSTHREGVVTNLDVGASILNYFGLPPLPGQGGTPIYSIHQSKGIKELIDFNNGLVTIYNQRPFLIKSYIYILISILALAAISLLFKRRYIRLIKPMLVFISIVPLVYLLLPLLQQHQLYKTAIIAISMAILFTALLCHLFESTRSRIIMVSGLTVMALLLDQWLGMRLIQASPLGYDVIGGARFYGMGNEYMGVLVGAACSVGAAIIESSNTRDKNIRKIMMIMGLIILYTMASPKLAANVGGTIAVFVAISITALMIQGKKIRIWHMVSIAGTMVVILIGVFLLDSLRVVDSQSHMGQTAIAIKENGLGELLNIFQRKISMNLRLFRTTVWTRVFLTSLAVIVLLLYRPVGIFRDVYKKHEILIKGLTGATIGSIAALIFNDSGIVAAATTMIFVAPPFASLIMDEVQKKVMDGEWEDGIRFKTSGR